MLLLDCNVSCKETIPATYGNLNRLSEAAFFVFINMTGEKVEWNKIIESGKHHVSEAIINRLVNEVVVSINRDQDFWNTNPKFNQAKSEIIEYIKKKFS